MKVAESEALIPATKRRREKAFKMNEVYGVFVRDENGKYYTPNYVLLKVKSITESQIIFTNLITNKQHNLNHTQFSYETLSAEKLTRKEIAKELINHLR